MISTPSKIDLILVVTLFFTTNLFAETKFNGKPDFYLEHLHKNNYQIDTSANAIVLYEKASFTLKYSLGNGAEIIENVRRVIKILTKDGTTYADVAVMYPDDPRAKIEIIGAETYNLINGKYTIKEMNSKKAFTEAVENTVIAKFSLPSVKEGSIIDYHYVVHKPFSFVFAEWDFQEELPKLHSEVTAEFPKSFKVAINTQTLQNFNQFDDSRNNIADSLIPDYYTSSINPALGPDYIATHWVRKNIKPYIKEPYNYNIKNYTEKILLQAVSLEDVERTANYISWAAFDIATWDKVNDFFARRISDFDPFGDNTEFKKSIIKDIFPNKLDSLSAAQKIFSFVRDNYKSTDDFHFGNIKDVIKNKSGSGSDLNLLLTSLLRSAGFRSNAVLLSTRNSIRNNKQMPILNRIDYLICMVVVNNEAYYLDASGENYPYGVLPEFCYNGFSWVIDKKGYHVNLSPDDIKEKHVISINTKNKDIDNYTLSISQYYGNTTAYKLRDEWTNDTTKIKKSILDILVHLPETELQSYRLAGLNNPDTPLVLEYDIKLKWGDADIITITPSLFNYFTENPFNTITRTYPIEMPHALEITYMMNLQLPEGRNFEEVPQSAIYKLDDNNYYKYLLSINPEEFRIELITKLIMKRTFFDTNEYSNIRKFIDDIITQQKKPCLIKKDI